jgi:hypothetical protein
MYSTGAEEECAVLWMLRSLRSNNALRLTGQQKFFIVYRKVAIDLVTVNPELN